MPFTPTHILAVVPFAHRWSGPGAFSALVIGCMVPDWPLYVPFGPSYELTHSLHGIFMACIPLGVALTAIFHFLLRRPLYELLPLSVRERLYSYVNAPAVLSTAALATMAMGVALGASTHVVWDAFTHRGEWGVEMLPVLYRPWLTVSTLEIPGFAVLQHGSSLIGLPILMALLILWYRRAPLQPVPEPLIDRGVRMLMIILFLLVPIAMIVWIFVRLSAPMVAAEQVFHVLFNGVTTAGLVLMILTLFYGLAFALLQRKTNQLV